MNASSVHRLYLDNASRFQGASSWMPTRLTLTENESDWFLPTIKRLEDLLRLERGWDGYDGVPASLMNVYFTIQMLERACWKETPTPQIVPLADGSLQVEWHTLYGDIELLVRGPNNVRAWKSLANDDEGIELEITNDVLPISNWIREITEPQFELQAAA
ncbi:hypothetical protein [Limnohabitans sp.]|uniref:hypothetical protein n=1 Tax=Limnohabitans sp. TaxID=1907725 RepID=UPI00286EC4E3|nr:hypothetical protein [Limnohabitans sp.]